MASALAQQGTECIVYTRADAADLPREVVVEPGHRVVYLPARITCRKRRSPTSSMTSQRPLSTILKPVAELMPCMLTTG
ncbi:MAG: hypothetical protein ACPHAQ_01440 [Ilumatobacteraceae bacterium]